MDLKLLHESVENLTKFLNNNYVKLSNLAKVSIQSSIDQLNEIELEYYSADSSDQYASMHFKWSELACNDPAGTPVPDEYRANAIAIAAKAEAIRARLCEQKGGEIALICNSCYRTPKYNAEQPGASKKSQHLYAKAMDLRSPKATPFEIKKAYLELVSEGIITDGGLGTYNSFIHIDNGDTRRW